VLVEGQEGVCIVDKGVEVVGVWRVDVFGMSIRCVFPLGNYEDGGAR
jgi:hypothetical protein